MSDKLTSAMYQTMPVSPINIRVTKYYLQPNNRRRRMLLQVNALSQAKGSGCGCTLYSPTSC